LRKRQAQTAVKIAIGLGLGEGNFPAIAARHQPSDYILLHFEKPFPIFYRTPFGEFHRRRYNRNPASFYTVFYAQQIALSQMGSSAGGQGDHPFGSLPALRKCAVHIFSARQWLLCIKNYDRRK